jgi:hypothetical protein
MTGSRALRDQCLNRDSMFLRHGGDFQGILNHLDYLQSLGVTTLWMTPVVSRTTCPTAPSTATRSPITIPSNPRLGGADRLPERSRRLRCTARGMKLIQDAVYNHVGLYHFLVHPGPARQVGWLHQWPVYTPRPTSAANRSDGPARERQRQEAVQRRLVHPADAGPQPGQPGCQRSS